MRGGIVSGLAWGCLAFTGLAQASERHEAFAIVLEVDAAQSWLLVSPREIPGILEAGVTKVAARKTEEVADLRAGSLIDFSVVREQESLVAEEIRVHRFESSDPQPLKAQRLELLQALTSMDEAIEPLGVGEAVPDFTLIDQNSKTVKLSQLDSKVVAVSFMYTRCRLANACFRLSNNLAKLRDRFEAALGKDLALLTVTFDPSNDGPEALVRYASTWNGNVGGWHFLTGPEEEVRRVCHMFGMNFWADMGMITHTIRTIVIDRDGRVAANLEGNEFTAQQLGDFVRFLIDRPAARPEVARHERSSRP
jgi:protein SCO1/2